MQRSRRRPRSGRRDAAVRQNGTNVDCDSVPKVTHEAFNDDDDDPLYEWECDALCVQETLVKQLHVPRGRYRKR